MESIQQESIQKLPPCLIHLISQYTTGNFQINVFSKLNKRTRNDLLTLVQNGRVLTFDMSKNYLLPLLSIESFTYLSSFTKSIKFIIDSTHFDLNQPNFSEDFSKKIREFSLVNIQRVCAFLISYIERDAQSFNFSLEINGYYSVYEYIISWLWLNK
ncbi:hypothetical protein FGO68_gene4571 [Halteria grandinella]|uniref:Uncharacterized protein n=1 Tax=Halteria grandinella TaxID=5974 RepID=A0A8J8NSE0_HALGN|nr:hypothetical protein FGO68_gene4571 [Halteria grandinella]